MLVSHNKLCCAPCCRSFGAPDFNGDALALSAAVDPFANPAPSLAVLRMWLAWLILFVLFYWGYPQVFEFEFECFNFGLGIDFRNNTSPKSTTEMS